MPKPTDYDKTHLRNMAAIGTRIDRIFKKAAEEAAKIGVSIKDLPEDRIFTFDDYPATQKQIERLMTALQQSMETTIVNGVRSSWTLSNNKNNALVSRIFGDRVGDLSKEQYKRYFSTNGAALETFLQRKEQGLSLSDRVWRYTTAFKREIELGLDLGIRSGESAAKMTRSLRQYLQHPDKLFRRVRDKHGNLKLSKAAAAFHPGRGVYRSSYKNARRLAATETNIAYRTSDHLRWQQMDFVVGIEIKLSNNHTLNGVPLTDICDTLAGRYPKDFKFVGWHPHCRCKAITVLKTEDEMAEDTSRILDGQQPTKSSVNTVRDVPAAFKDWIEERKDRIEMGGNLPYFIKDNRKRVDAILGHETVVGKSPLEIAKERHEARTPAQVAAIQQAWNERRIANIQQAIADGYLSKECAEGLSTLTQEQFNDSIAFLQKRAAAHAARTPEEIQAIKDAWAAKQKRDATTKLIANNVFKVAQDWQEVDFSVLEKIIANNNLGAMREEAKNVAQAIKTMRDKEKALADLIPDVHGWHKMFTLDELKEAHGRIQSTLDFWKTKYGADLATDSNLVKLQSELEQKIKFVENPGAFKKGAVAKKYWQVTQDAYIKHLDKVELRIQIIELDKQYKDLLGFKTTSKEFKEYMAKAKTMIDEGDPMGAKMWLNYANSKKDVLEARRGGGNSGSITFKEMTEEKVKQLLDQFETNTVAGQDRKLRPWTEKEWANLTEEERFIVTKYTQTYKYLNDRLRTGTTDSWRPESEYKHDLPILTRALNKIKAPRDMVVRRGVDDYKVPELARMLSQVKEGDVLTEKGFLSTACHREKGFFQELEMVILVPKGARGIYAEPFSHYTDSGCYDIEWDEIWNGTDKQSIGNEFEWIGQRGCQFKVLKKTGRRIILQLIGQLK